MINYVAGKYSTFKGYIGPGMLMSLGFEPLRRDTAGVVQWGQAFQGHAVWNKSGALDTAWSSLEGTPTRLGGWKTLGGGLKRGMMAGQLAFSAYNVYQGYEEGGLWGGIKAASWDLAVSSALAKFAFPGVGKLNPSFLGMAGRGIGAAVGSGIGGSLLGIPGQWAGAYIGAAPLKFATKHPLLLGGTALAAVGVVGTRMAMKGGYEILKQGHRYSQMKKTIQTSGDMSAFMTQSANTMRARAVSAIHKSHLNARSALGHEAQFMHMPSRNYHSRYRRYY